MVIAPAAPVRVNIGPGEMREPLALARFELARCYGRASSVFSNRADRHCGWDGGVLSAPLIQIKAAGRASN